MFDRLERLLLRWLRVPPEPEPPFGNPASVRVFRASRKLYWLRMLHWGFTQSVALVGIVFWFTIIGISKHEAARMRSQPPEAARMENLPRGRNLVLVKQMRKIPPSLFVWLSLAEWIGIGLYVSQLFITYAMLRLDYEMRWYIVTDRSLRIRWGIWNVQEATMSYANLQQVVVSQGPLERLLGIANVRVESAGGGAKGPEHGETHADPMHSGAFHGVENAAEIRDLILDRLKRFRTSSGLGDPDEPVEADSPAPPSSPPALPPELLAASRELVEEARKLRSSLV